MKRMSMTNVRLFCGCYVLLAVLLSSFAAPARAHEVVPVIADFTVEEGTLTFDMRMNIEAFVAGIDLDVASDTSDTPEDTRYDDLRAMPPETLEPLVQRWAEGWLPTLGIDADGPVEMSLERVEIAPVGDTAYTRETHVFLTGTIPDGAREMRVAWPDGSGDVILRQQGVDALAFGRQVGVADALPQAGEIAGDALLGQGRRLRGRGCAVAPGRRCAATASVAGHRKRGLFRQRKMRPLVELHPAIGTPAQHAAATRAVATLGHAHEGAGECALELDRHTGARQFGVVRGADVGQCIGQYGFGACLVVQRPGQRQGGAHGADPAHVGNPE